MKKLNESWHEWTVNDTILCLYYSRYGLKNLYFKKEDELCDFIGCSIAALKKHSMNIRFLNGYSTGVLDHYSKQQEEVVEEYKTATERKLFLKVKEIINQDEVLLAEEFKKRGKSYNKFTAV